MKCPKFIRPISVFAVFILSPWVVAESPHNLVEGSYVLKSTLYGNPEVEAEYLIPMGIDGKPGPKAHNIVFYAPYVPEKNILKKEHIRYFADTLGYTVFSFEFETKLEDIDDRTKCYFYPEAGALSLVFETQDKLVDQFKFPRRKLLVMGMSAGSTMAANLAVHYPDKIEAVAFAGGWRYDLPQNFSPVKWCFLVTKGDVRVPANDTLCEMLRDLGFNSLYAVNPPIWKNAGKPLWRHVTNDTGKSILQAFIKSIAELRGSTDEAPSPEKWSFISSVADQKNIFENTPETLAKTLKNQQLFYPSAEFANLWKKIPRIETVAIPSENKSLECFQSLPSQPPLGIILCNREWTPFNQDQIEDDLSLLSESGYVALAVKNTAKNETNPNDVVDCIKWIGQNPNFQKLNIYACGYNESSRSILEAINKVPLKNMKAFININSKPTYSLQIEEISKTPLKLPVLVLLDGSSYKKALATGIKVKEIPSLLKKSEQKPEQRWQVTMEELLAFCKANAK